MKRLPWLLPLSALLLAAADPAWMSKPIPEWTVQDATQILTDSPWARTVTAAIAAVKTEDQLREGGNMGQPHGIGIDGLDGNEPKSKLPPILGNKPRSAATSIKLRIRWETARPVRVAELKARENEPPTLEGEGYQIAVYGIPAASVKGDPKSLGEPLKKDAALRREGKKDVKPVSVEVFQTDDGIVVVYRFPLAAEISTKDLTVDFQAVIGRLILKQTFDLAKMEFQGKLEL